MNRFPHVSTALRTLGLGLLLSISQQVAHADVWGWVDDQGTAHFASYRVDARYQVYFREGQDFDSREMGEGAEPAPARGSSVERMRTFFDISPAYKAVRHHLRTASDAHGIDYALLQALIATESGFNAGAVSPKGAVGLMQLMPATAQRYGVADEPKSPIARKLADPSLNIRTGARYLRYLLDLFPGKLELVLAAYNAGEGAVQRAGNRIPNYPETQNYVKTVMQLYQVLQPGGPSGGPGAGGGAPTRVRMEIPGRIAARGNLPTSAGQAHALGPQDGDAAIAAE